MTLRNLVKKNIIIALISIIVIIIGLGAFSYSFFLKVDETEENVVKYGDLEVEFANNTDTVSRISDIPRTDAEGFDTTPFTFTITNTGTLKATYTVLMYDDNDYISKNNLTKTNDLYMKYNIDGGTPSLVSSITNDEVITDSLEPGAKVTYNFRFWLTENAPNEVLGTSMVKKIKVKAEYIPESSTSTEG